MDFSFYDVLKLIFFARAEPERLNPLWLRVHHGGSSMGGRGAENIMCLVSGSFLDQFVLRSAGFAN